VIQGVKVTGLEACKYVDILRGWIEAVSNKVAAVQVTEMPKPKPEHYLFLGKNQVC
jgi:hypothetical protein